MKARRLSALLLVAPLALFLAVFFIWPIVAMMSESVSDPAMSRGLPSFARAASSWTGGAPTKEMQDGFVADLRAIPDDQQVGDIVRRLNSARSGFRTLMGKTVSAVRGSTGPVDLAAIDPRWKDEAWWRVIAEGSRSAYTDRNLLAAVDLQRDASGAIAAMPAGSSANLDIMLRTFAIAAMVTLACALIGYPYALLAASVTGWQRQLLLGAVLLPLWTSLLVRTAAWFILLQDNGPINGLLRGLGLIDGPIPLIFNRLGVVIAMTHVLLPFMVLPIFAVLVTIPRNLMPAAASLGAPPWRAFLRVMVPLSLRGLASGMLLVFMSAIGYYITPALVGGPTDQMISSVIAYYATGSANWGMAGALGIVLLAITLLLYAVYDRIAGDKARASA